MAVPLFALFDGRRRKAPLCSSEGEEEGKKKSGAGYRPGDGEYREEGREGPHGGEYGVSPDDAKDANAEDVDGGGGGVVSQTADRGGKDRHQGGEKIERIGHPRPL